MDKSKSEIIEQLKKENDSLKELVKKLQFQQGIDKFAASCALTDVQ